MTKTIIIFFLVIITGILSCSKMDDYKEKFIPSGAEIVYAGKLDSLKAHSGRHRVEITGLFVSDPRVTSCRIYWDSKADSITVPVTRTTATDTLRQIIGGLSEGSHSFTVVAFDAQGNRSVPVSANSFVYGERYENGLLTRAAVSYDYFDGDSVQVTLGDYDASSGLLGNQITYLTLNGATSILFSPAATETATLYNYKKDNYFIHRSLYKPDLNSIDTFYAPADTIHF